MNIKPVIKYFVILCVSLSLISSAGGQAGRGKARIAGAVVDETGNPVTGAKVVIQFQGEGALSFETKTNKKGEWGFLGLGTGQWLVTVTADGYIPAAQKTSIRQLDTNPKMTIVLKKVQTAEGGLIKDEATFELLEKGNQLFSDRNYDEALQAFREFQEKNPEAYQILLNIANCYREKGEYETAIGEYNKLIEKAPKDPSGNEFAAKALAGIGECYLKKEDIPQAQNYFRQSIEMYPNNELLAYNVGEIYFSNQKLDEAVQYFGIASKIKPDWPDPYYKLGLVYLNKAEYEAAKENLTKFLALEPSSERSESVKSILEYLDKMKK